MLIKKNSGLFTSFYRIKLILRNVRPNSNIRRVTGLVSTHKKCISLSTSYHQFILGYWAHFHCVDFSLDGWGGERYWSLKLYNKSSQEKGPASHVPQCQIWTFFSFTSIHACLQISLANFSFLFSNIQYSPRSFTIRPSIIWLHPNCT